MKSAKNSRSFGPSLAMLAVLLASGCSMNPPLREPSSPDEAVTRALTAWPEPVIEREGALTLVLLTPLSVPAEVAAKAVSLRLNPGATIRDLSAALAAYGLNVIVADPEAADKTFYLPRYDGTVGGLLRTLSRAVDVFFTWDDGVIVVSNKERFSVSIPQEEKLAEALTKAISDLGGKAVAHAGASMLVFETSARAFEEIKVVIERMTSNAALVTLEVALLSVALNDDSRRGVDWESLTLALGKGAAGRVTAALEGGSTTNQVAAPTTGTDAGAAAEVAAAVATSYGLLKNGSFQTGVFNEHVSLSAVLNFLDTYGSSETLQNVRTKTLSGHEATLSNVTEIPYIRGVSSTTSGSVSSSITGSSESATAQDGITFKLVPTYDRDANTVTLTMDLSVDSVVSFNTLSAGNQIGTLTQPTTATRSLKDTLRLRPGQTAVIGGVIYETLADSRSTVAGWNAAEGRTLAKKRNEMFIVIRPTVSQFGKLISSPEDLAAQQQYLPAGRPAVPLPPRVGAAPSTLSGDYRTPGGVPVDIAVEPTGTRGTP